MRSPARPHRLPTAGITLIECLVYVAATFVVLGAAVGTLLQSWSASHKLQRATDDIIRVMQAGERWRDDVRRAVGPIRRFVEGGEQALEVPQSGGVTVYLLSDYRLLRRGAGSEAWVELLSRVRASEMTEERRAHVAAWRWEVELATKSRRPGLRPLFTFLAVPGTAAEAVP